MITIDRSEKISLNYFVALGLSAWVLTAEAKDFDKAPLDTKGSAAASPWARYDDWPSDSYTQFNTLRTKASPAMTKPPEVEKVINGDPAKGKELAFDRSRGGSCVACHIMGPDTPELPGNVGPDLSNIGNLRDDTWLFNYVYEPRTYNPAAIMPPWGTHGLFSLEEIKDIVAYLKSLKTPATFKSKLDDPANRPQPVEDRDNLDPLENSAMQSSLRKNCILSQDQKVNHVNPATQILKSSSRPGQPACLAIAARRKRFWA